MGKALETKRKILGLLKNRKMTITQLSRELGLSNATVSQHMDELRAVGAVEKIDSEYFRKFKYYKPADPMPITARYIIGALALFVLLGGIYAYNSNLQNNMIAPNALTIANGSSSVQIPIGGFAACPMLYYSINGTITSYFGLRLYYINTSIGMVPNYVMPSGSLGTLQISENVSNVLNEPSIMPSRSHYAYLINITNTSASAINLSISPANFTVNANERLNITLTVVANESSAGSYWLEVDGPCGGGLQPAIITIGNLPYAGTPTYATMRYP